MRISDWSSDVCSSDLQCTALWGCLNMPDAERRCTDASLLWSAEVDRSVLRLLALPASGRLGTPFDLATCDAKAFVVNGSECQHVLLRGRAGSIRLDVFSGSLDRKSTRLNSSH